MKFSFTKLLVAWMAAFAIVSATVWAAPDDEEGADGPSGADRAAGGGGQASLSDEIAGRGSLRLF